MSQFVCYSVSRDYGVVPSQKQNLAKIEAKSPVYRVQRLQREAREVAKNKRKEYNCSPMFLEVP